jgi:hypothetical protein
VGTGILEGGKGDIMILPRTLMKAQQIITFENELTAAMFEGNDIKAFAGVMVTVLGTPLQNRIY